MAYTATNADIDKVRWEIQDVTVGLYILDDSTITYFIEKHNGNIARASIDSARAVLLSLSQRNDETVDVLSIRSSKTAEQYRLALELYIKNPTLNPLLANAGVWVGNVSNSEMDTNNSTIDNHIPKLISEELEPNTVSSSNPNPFFI